jgi:hypothetical protein
VIQADSLANIAEVVHDKGYKRNIHSYEPPDLSAAPRKDGAFANNGHFMRDHQRNACGNGVSKSIGAAKMTAWIRKCVTFAAFLLAMAAFGWPTNVAADETQLPLFLQTNRNMAIDRKLNFIYEEIKYYVE